MPTLVKVFEAPEDVDESKVMVSELEGIPEYDCVDRGEEVCIGWLDRDVRGMELENGGLVVKV